MDVFFTQIHFLPDKLSLFVTDQQQLKAVTIFFAATVLRMRWFNHAPKKFIEVEHRKWLKCLADK